MEFIGLAVRGILLTVFGTFGALIVYLSIMTVLGLPYSMPVPWILNLLSGSKKSNEK